MPTLRCIALRKVAESVLMANKSVFWACSNLLHGCCTVSLLAAMLVQVMLYWNFEQEQAVSMLMT
jgi:hypothetical protein